MTYIFYFSCHSLVIGARKESAAMVVGAFSIATFPVIIADGFAVNKLA